MFYILLNRFKDRYKKHKKKTIYVYISITYKIARKEYKCVQLTRMCAAIRP